MKLIIRFLVSAVVIILAANITPGVDVQGGFWAALGIALVLSIVNIFVRPLFTLITIPITILTLGIFLLFINAFMIWLVGALMESFVVTGFLPALIFGIFYSVIMTLVDWLIERE